MARDNGGIIGKLNTPTTSVASGVWALEDQYQAQLAGTWPLVYPLTTFNNSCRFDDGSSDYLTFTPSSNGNRKVFTISLWVKRANLGSAQNMLGSSDSSFGNGLFLQFQSDDTLRFGFQDPNEFKATSRVFRDVGAWYHIVVGIDVTQSSNSDKIKIYVNGVQETSFGTDNTVADADKDWNNTQAHSIGRSGAYASQYFDGYLAEVINIDGQQLTPTSFGGTYPSGIWGPKAYTGTYGTNGFKLNFSDSSALGDDTSGNTNDFTANNLTSIDQSTDTPSNNFATMNPLTNNGTLSEGNLKVVTSTSLATLTTASTVHVSQAKWYVEFKCVSTTSSTNFNIGITSDPSENIRSSEYMGQSADSYGVLGSNGNFYNNNSSVAYMNSFTAGDIIGIALDLDNNYIYFSKNGVWQNSGDPESGSSGTGGKAITAASSQSSGVYAFGVGEASGSSSMTFEINYGNPTFTISSGNSDAEGFGNFEYAVPSGYFALCTKNLAEYG